MFDYKLLIKEYEKKGYAEFKSLYEKKRSNINLLPLETRTKFNLLLARLALINNDNATYNDAKNLLDYENNTCTCKEILQNLENANKKKHIIDIKDNTGEMTFVKLPDTNVEMLSTLVTQKLFKEVMGTNPSYFQGPLHLPDEGEVQELRPVERVSFYDAIYFCNKLSRLHGLEPVYSVNGVTDVTLWNYTLCEGLSISATVNIDYKKNGYRVPKTEEWEKAVKKVYDTTDKIRQITFDNFDWNTNNSHGRTHQTRIKKTCDFYDILGNVKEICFSEDSPRNVYSKIVTTGLKSIGNKNSPRNGCSDILNTYTCGGSYSTNIDHSQINSISKIDSPYRSEDVGFRIVRRINNDNATYNDVNNPSDYKNNPLQTLERNILKSITKGIIKDNTGEMTFVKLPNTNVEMLSTLVTQKLFYEVMGTNPSYFQGPDNPPDKDEVQELRPVENVSFYDAIYFCNKLSRLHGLEPVYDVDGEKDVTRWEYTPCKGHIWKGNKTFISINHSANGYRLPKNEEWRKAVFSMYTSSTDTNYDELNNHGEWISPHSNHKTHSVGLKKRIDDEFCDILGNVRDMCCDLDKYRYNNDIKAYGGAWNKKVDASQPCSYNEFALTFRQNDIGFRIVRRIK